MLKDINDHYCARNDCNLVASTGRTARRDITLSRMFSYCTKQYHTIMMMMSSPALRAARNSHERASDTIDKQLQVSDDDGTRT